MSTSGYEYGALQNVLLEYVSATEDLAYENLFSEQTGYLKCEGKNKTWAISYKKPQNLIEMLKKVQEGLYGMCIEDIPNGYKLVQRINTVYSQALFSTPANFQVPVIGFNSRCKDEAQMFSNFYSSLVVFPDPETGKEIIFPSSEAAYQAHKTLVLEKSGSSSATSSFHVRPKACRKLDFGDQGNEPPHPSVMSNPKADTQTDDEDVKEQHPSSTVAFSKESSPMKAKKAGSRSPQKAKGLSDEMARAKYELMRSIVRAKLRDNPHLLMKLMDSQAFLVEDTGENSFWGGNPRDKTLVNETLPPTKNSRNVLGQIYMSIRK
ncbi:MAG: NADAR family protein [Parachlamydiales bacterium]|nr:NADAR family protein [Parachlamydiales bacterium]